MSKTTYGELKAAITVIHEVMLKMANDDWSRFNDTVAVDQAYATLFKFAGIEEKKDEK